MLLRYLPQLEDVSDEQISYCEDQTDTEQQQSEGKASGYHGVVLSPFLMKHSKFMIIIHVLRLFSSKCHIAKCLEEVRYYSAHMAKRRTFCKLLRQFAVFVDGLSQEYDHGVYHTVQYTAQEAEYCGQDPEQQRTVNHIFQIQIFIPAVHIASHRR